jgi:IclR family transcriptional regulator, acetate operon repressor
VAGTNSAERIIDIMMMLVDYPEGMALSEIARQMSVAKSETHRLLGILTARGLVEQPPGREAYRLSLKWSAMGFRYVSQTGLLEICQPIIDRLAAEIGELSRVALADQRGLTWVAKSQGSRFGLRYDPDMGAPLVLHSTASGRAWLATLPPQEANALVEAEGFAVPERFARQKINSIKDLESELERTRERGYGLMVEEIEPGTAAIAMAIDAGAGKKSPGTISVLGPIIRMSPLAVEEIVPRLAAAARELGELWPILEMNGNLVKH